MIIVYITLALIGMFIIWYETRDTSIVRIKKGYVADFKTYMELVGLPIVCMYQGDQKYYFIADTGGNVSYIDKNSPITKESKETTGTFLTTNGNRNKCEVADLHLYYNTHHYVCDNVRIIDLTTIIDTMYGKLNIKITGLLGGDFFAKYNYCIDYKEFIVYERV